MRQVLVRWTVPGGSGTILNVFNFADTGDISSARAAINAFLSPLGNRLGNGVRWSIDVSGKELDTRTGQLTGEWSDGPAYDGGGSDGGGQAVANATSALIRWGTNTVSGGRRVRGRTFIPGLSVSQLTNGELGSAAQTAFNESAQNMLSDGVDFGIWHRPTQNSGGNLSLVVSGAAWRELATQRRRRG